MKVHLSNCSIIKQNNELFIRKEESGVNKQVKVIAEEKLGFMQKAYMGTMASLGKGGWAEVFVKDKGSKEEKKFFVQLSDLSKGGLLKPDSEDTLVKCDSAVDTVVQFAWLSQLKGEVGISTSGDVYQGEMVANLDEWVQKASDEAMESTERRIQLEAALLVLMKSGPSWLTSGVIDSEKKSEKIDRSVYLLKFVENHPQAGLPNKAELKVISSVSKAFHKRCADRDSYFRLMDSFMSGSHIVMRLDCKEAKVVANLKSNKKAYQRWSSHYDMGKGKSPDNPQFAVDGDFIHTILAGTCQMAFGKNEFPVDWGHTAEQTGGEFEKKHPVVWLQLENAAFSGFINTIKHGSDWAQYKATGKNVGPHGYGQTDKEPIYLDKKGVYDHTGMRIDGRENPLTG